MIIMMVPGLAKAAQAIQTLFRPDICLDTPASFRRWVDGVANGTVLVLLVRRDLRIFAVFVVHELTLGQILNLRKVSNIERIINFSLMLPRPLVGLRHCSIRVEPWIATVNFS